MPTTVTSDLLKIFIYFENSRNRTFSDDDVLLADYRLRRLFSCKEISQLRRTYYSARAFAQTQVHSLFLHSHNPMGRQSDTIGKRSGAGPTFTCSPMHG
ncbi:hypothetical protein B5X24_HaOG208808 [Helicoverpa armigera]|uniref:Uncharacterized protein n=1 Tax=Helicoverpa armigera TaxID=29058 RepID=A0A2W1BLP1_HELAM|nr:hypothetical protein B5X24_HaOG208808 [Helicoverpa armigera]